MIRRGNRIKMVILVPEVHFMNFPLYYILSFVFRVEAYEMQAPFLRFKRIKILDLSKYTNWEESVGIESDAVDISEKILQNLPVSAWNIKIQKHNIDLSLKAKQEFQREIRKLLFLKKAAAYYRDGEVCIAGSLRLRFLAKTAPSNDLFRYANIRMVSAINVLLDRMFFKFFNIYKLAATIYQFAYGIIRNNNKMAGKIEYIYDGISPRELSIDKNKLTFSWLIDNKVVSKENVLFLLPRPDFQMKRYLKDNTGNTQLLTSSLFDMPSFASRKKLFSCFAIIMKTCVKVLLPFFDLKSLMNADYLISIVKWIPLIESTRPRVYLTTSSNMGIENPATAYFNTTGIKTIMWFYGTSVYRFLTSKKAERFKFRDIVYCNIMSRVLVAWNQDVKKFLEEHPQNDLQIKIIGPLMCGEEGVFKYSKEELCKFLGLPSDFTTKYIAVFDCPHISRMKAFSIYPQHNSPEYNYFFIRDTYRLLHDFQDIKLIYKPKRSLTSGKFTYTSELKELFKEMEKDPRVIILDYNIDPWIPFAMADICISLPFESPSIIALHYGKPGLFHDPTDIALYHQYQGISELIAHNYEELKSKVEAWLYGNKKVSDLPRINEFQGAYPKENSSEKFREFLKL